jgi:OmpA-OmpF porin, OOP family
VAIRGLTLGVVGHADARGTDEHNQKLGQSRAESVSKYLSGKGMPAPEMGTESRGEQDATGTDEIGMAFDRRVDIRLGD